jgi:hypothetical protein
MSDAPLISPAIDVSNDSYAFIMRALRLR